ncbi:hypothetical protein AB7828_26480 [Tardiphaga sp. 215_C5_N2_1]|uniref:hypothetical protein n=1 Tax=Tardiphaga sp. 215_C5_N2_1 TaxID=3240774 RepID=UPI003F8B88C2
MTDVSEQRRALFSSFRGARDAEGGKREPGIPTWPSAIWASHVGIPGSRPASAGRAPE